MDHPLVSYIELSEASHMRQFFDSLHLLNTSDYLINLNCKYYSCDVRIKQTHCQEEASNLEGIIINFTGNESRSWDSAFEWMQFAMKSNIPLRLLTCQSLDPKSLYFGDSDSLSFIKRTILDHAFELIEFSPEPDTYETDDEFGLVRLKSALLSHMWPNIRMKANTHPSSPLGNIQMNVNGTSSVDKLKVSPVTSNKLKNTEMHNAGSDVSTDEEVETFESLLKDLPFMKEKIAQLDKSKRYEAAESFTKRFWRAVGGSEDEVEGLRDN